MKITKNQLRRIIKEEMEMQDEVDAVSELKRWFMETSKVLGSMKISNSQGTRFLSDIFNFSLYSILRKLI